ncbi:MAG: ATP-binding protein [Nocardioides sp.]
MPQAPLAVDLRRTPLALRAYLGLTTLAALVVPWLVTGPAADPGTTTRLVTAAVLLVVAVLNVEIGRVLTGGLERAHQPHKALSAWAFACALLLPAPWLLVVVPLTYAHTWWRGLRIPWWKWAGSATFLVLSGCLAAVVADAVMGDEANFMRGRGGLGLVAVLLAAIAFLALEALLFCGPAYLNHAEDEVWLRQTLRSASFYGTEAGVLVIGALLAAVWTGGSWFVLLFVPIYLIAQRAVLHEPLRQRAEAAAVLAEKNAELERANQFKSDLMGMLGHEIGNPLTSVMGYAQVGIEAIDQGDIDFARRAMVVVDRGATQMQAVLHDLLALVASDRAALVAQVEPCPVAPHLTAAAANQPPTMRPEVDVAPDVVALVQPSHLDQMVANLLSNARKYAGGATLLAARLRDDGRVEITVTDQGAGVPEAFRDDLFERFSREAASSREASGSGLGLFITRELARVNGGEVELRSTGPEGSVFAIVVPAST